MYTNFSSSSFSVSFSQSGSPCWLTFGWLSSPSTPYCYSSVFPSDVLFSLQSLTCSQLWEESKQSSPSEEPQTREYCQRNNFHHTKAFVSSLLSGGQVVTMGITLLSLWKTMGTEVSSTGMPQKQEYLCSSSMLIIWGIVLYSTVLCSSVIQWKMYLTQWIKYVFSLFFSLVADMAQKWVINPKKYSEKKPDHI